LFWPSGAKALGMNVTFVKPPYERLMIKLKPVRAQLLPDLPSSLALHA
jgi:hypothetical protein